MFVPSMYILLLFSLRPASILFRFVSFDFVLNVYIPLLLLLISDLQCRKPLSSSASARSSRMESSLAYCSPVCVSFSSQF